MDGVGRGVRLEPADVTDTVDDLARVKAVIPSVVKPGGFAVLNADDPRVLAMRDGTPGTVVLTSVLGEAGNPAVAAHLDHAKQLRAKLGEGR